MTNPENPAEKKPRPDSPAHPAPTPRGARQGSLGTSRRGKRREPAKPTHAKPNRTKTVAPKAHPKPAKDPAHLPTLEEAPIVAVSLATSGIHPTTSRTIGISMVFYSGATDPQDPSALNLGEEVLTFTRRLNPGEDIGPRHLHGYLAADLTQSKNFPSSAELLRKAFHERTVILHQAGMTWGFIAHEFRRAQRAANRNRRNRNRHRGMRKVATPEPLQIIDTLGTARRQATQSVDSRLRAIASHYDLDLSRTQQQRAMLAVEATASVERGKIPADDLLLADAHLTAYLAAAQAAADRENPELTDSVAVLDPTILSADPFGIQRSEARVHAARASRRWVNPGVWKPGKRLVQGMEFVISPDVSMDADILIDKAVAAGLAYSEKLNRRSSVVICNESYPLRGKAMHAERKGIPLVTDQEFLDLLDDVKKGRREPKPVRAGTGTRPRTSASGPPRNFIPAPRTDGEGTKAGVGSNKNSQKRRTRRRPPIQND